MRLVTRRAARRKIAVVALSAALSAAFGSVAQAGPVGPDGSGYYPVQYAADEGSLVEDRSMSVPRIARPDGGGYFPAPDVYRGAEAVRTVEVRSFSWRDAGLGATGALALLLVVLGLTTVMRGRHRPSAA